MKTKLFYLALFFVLLCSCERNSLCDCDDDDLPLLLGGTSPFPVLIVVEFEKAEYADYIYIVNNEKYNQNEFVNMIPRSLDFDQSPFLHITGNHYLVNWNWLVSYHFSNFKDNYIIADKWSEYYNIDAMNEKALVKSPIKKIRAISPHELNHYIEDRNLSIDSIAEIYLDFTFVTNTGPEFNALEHQITDEDWVNLPQNRKDYYLEEYNLTNDNFKKILKTLRYLFQDENWNKYI